MTIAAGMKDIVQDIVSSREVMVAEVKGLKKEANEMLGSFETSRGEMGVQLSHDLAQDKAKMRREVKTMRSGLAQGAAARESEVNGMLNDFQGSRQQMGAALKKDLAEHTQAVRGEVAKLRQETGASHRDMSAKLRGNLAQGVAVRKPEVHVMLNDFQSAHKQMGAEQRKLLADYDRGIKSEVAGMRQETIADLRKARTAWQALPSNGHAKGGGAEILPKGKALVEEPHNVEAKLLAAVNEHPKGITLTEVADNLGIAPIVLGRASKSLLDKKLIRKKHKFYVPASAK